MTLTLTLSRLPSLDRPLEKLATAALTEPPIKNSASGVRAAPPTMLTTLPCEAFNSGQNSRVSRTQPKNFSAKPSSQTASGKSGNAPARVAPALLTSTSQRWKRSLTRRNNCSHASSLRRSPATVNGCGPSAATALAAAARFCSEEDACTVCAPSRANASAMPRPMPRLLAGYDVCLDDHSYMPTEVMAQCRGLKHIVFLGTGASSYMDVPALNGLGIKVHTIKGYGDTAVAEHTMALIFACCRGLARMDRAVRGGVWDPLESMQLNGKTLGLIGLGGIGREVARIARGVGMEVIGYNRSARPEAGVPLLGLDELLARADVISLHLALNDETRGLLDAKRLARTKRGVILVNTARGALVEDTALLDALASGHIRHAGLDVFHAEPLKPDHPLARMENVTITSHAAFRTLEASETLIRRAIDIVRGIVAPSSSAAGKD